MMKIRKQRARRDASVPSTKLVANLPGGASRLAALLLAQILSVFSLVAPCQPGAALRHLGNLFRTRDTSPLACGFVQHQRGRDRDIQ